MREFLPDHHGVAIVVLFLLGSAMIFGLGGRAHNDLWLAHLLGIVLAMPMVSLYARFRSILPKENLYVGLDTLFGTRVSRLLAFLYAFSAWRLGCLVAKDVATFVDIVALDFTPQPVFMLFLAILALWATKEGLETLGRWSVVALKAILFAGVLTLLLLTTTVDPQQFLPVLYNGWMPVLTGSLELLDFPFLEIAFLIWAFEALSSKTSPYKILIPGFIIAALALAATSSMAMAVIGPDKYESSYFPVYLAVSRISLFRFLTRLEATVGVIFVLTCFLKVAVCLMVTCKGFAHALGFTDYRFLVTPFALGLIPGSQWFAKNQMEIHMSATKVVAPYEILIYVILPFVFWISAEIKMFRRSKKSKGTSGP
jgi:spore germination protein KB